MSADDNDGRLRNTLYRTITRSSRRMTPARRLLYALTVPLALAIIRAWWALCRVVRVEGSEHLDAALARAPSLVPCYWHQHQLYCGKYLVEQRARGLVVGWLISPSVDGELGAMMVRRFGAAVIRGSSTHTGARASMIALVRPWVMAMGRNAAAIACRSGMPKLTLDAPSVMFRPSSSCTSAIVSSTVDIPTRSAPRPRNIRISAGVSKCGPASPT